MASPSERIRYGMCWEDADILLPALAIRPGATVVSIASAGDNTLSLLTANPGRVIALDVNQAQLFCLELRVAAYAALEHRELLELMGSRPSERRPALYARARTALGPAARAFWDARPAAIANGIGGAGKFEHYVRLFRRAILPLAHSARDVEALLEPRPRAARRRFYAERWDTRRWRLMFRIAASRPMLSRLGRDPSAFAFVDGRVAEPILARVRYGLTELEPAANPYLRWILRGSHDGVLPHALRPENVAVIRDNLGRLELRRQSLQDFASTARARSVDAFNLSDLFEYLSVDETGRVLTGLAAAARPGARLAYWNVLVPRSAPASLAHRIRPVEPLATDLWHQDKAFFYSRFVVEEVVS